MRLDPHTHTLRRSGAPAIVNPFDLPAIEEVLRLRDQTGGHLTVLTMGPPAAEAALRETLARGADAAILLCDSAFAGSDTWATSLTLAAAIRRLGGADLIVCGRQASDGDTAQVGPGLAAQLGCPQITFVSRIHALDASSVIADRTLEDGCERIRAQLPCVLAIGRQIHPVRIASLPGLLRSRAAVIPRWGATELGLAPADTGLKGSPTRVTRVTAHVMRRHCVFLTGSCEARVQALLEEMRGRGFRVQGSSLPPDCRQLEQMGRNAQRRTPDVQQPLTPETRPLNPLPPPPSTPRDIWVVVELDESGGVREVALELLAAARTLAAKTGGAACAVLLGGPGTSASAALLRAHGADGVLLIEDALLAQFQDERHAAAVAGLIAQHGPGVVLFGATAVGRSLAARVAVAARTGLTADCTALDIDAVSGNLLQTRPAFGGNLLATIVTAGHRPQMATVRPRVMRVAAPDWTRPGWLRHEALPDAARTALAVRIGYEADASGGTLLADADVIVAGGRGVGNALAFDTLRRVAESLGGEVGASRAAVEAGWMPASRQIGQTGRTVRPRLYLACGISGQIQHLAGMSEAATVVAIDRDPEAPIFNCAHIGIVGDLHEILAELLSRLGPPAVTRGSRASGQ
ncbi:MAG: FAD-binding protein [Kiritimatiellae bacterium]|nr:FAD-binding protein [Kiritimatiellia bacterium]